MFLHDHFAPLEVGVPPGPPEEFAEAVGGLEPLAEQPAPQSLKPGLAVTYYFGIRRFFESALEFDPNFGSPADRVAVAAEELGNEW